MIWYVNYGLALLFCLTVHYYASVKMRECEDQMWREGLLRRNRAGRIVAVPFEERNSRRDDA